MTDYATWKEVSELHGFDIEKEMFECDCGRELVAEMTECDRCGAHYEVREGGVVQVAPPIGEY